MREERNKLRDELIEEECDLKLKYALRLHNERLEKEFEEFQHTHESDSMPEELEKKLRNTLNAETNSLKKRQPHIQGHHFAKAALLAIVTLGILSTLLINNVEAIKHRFDNFVEEVRTEYLKLTPSEGTQEEENNAVLQSWEDIHGAWYPEYLPEGFEVEAFEEMAGQKSLVFENEVGEQIIFRQIPADGTTVLLDNEAEQQGTLKLRDQYECYWTQTGDLIQFCWLQSDYIMLLTAELPFEELEKTAESLTYLK